MQTLSVPYNGQVYQFQYYSTTLHTENIVFLITKDQKAAHLLKEDHFFVTMDIARPGAYCFNAVVGTEEEVAFKEVISDLLMHRFLIMATSGFLN